MVIVTSDSNNTLVSLGATNHNKQSGIRRVGSLGLLQQATQQRYCNNNEEEQQQPISFVETHLYLPQEEDEEFWGEDADDEDDYLTQSVSLQEPLYLPEQSSCSSEDNNLSLSVDECLSYLPVMVEASEALHAEPAKVFTETSPERLIYVGQGEVGHAVPLQADVICSDRATTCHIVAFYSTSSDTVPLASCAHLDGPHYQDCLRDVFARHAQHHSHSESSAEMDMHICGGFDTPTSKQLSNWLLYTLAELAREFSSSFKCILKTAAISALNSTVSQDGEAVPMARGLALFLRTGQVSMMHIPSPKAVAGPDYVLRQARLWCPQEGSNHQKLSLVHEEKGSLYQVTPFSLQNFAEIPLLMQLPDQVLLQYTSTSPHAEDEADFCNAVRDTLQLLGNSNTTFFIGNHPAMMTPRFYKRLQTTNQWILL